MDKELNVFRNLLLWLWDRYPKPWDDGYGRDAYQIACIYLGNRSFPKRENLEASLPTETQVAVEFPGTQFLHLPPFKTRSHYIIVPRIRLVCNFGRNIPLIRCYLGLFLLHEGCLRSIGFRFEAPEGPGIHHYYHTQLITDEAWTIPRQEHHIWLPTEQPAFPLDADNPVTLILCLLVSLYGVDCLRDLVNSGIPDLRDYLDKVRASILQTQKLIYYWKVEYDDPEIAGRHRVMHYSTFEDPGNFKTAMVVAHPRCNILGITMSTYKSLREEDRLVYP